ncbi:hypothetical protein [Marinilabilia rubra]|uniref:DUF4468 domain-containing protein n=1 Tax=Marinilabilia rubra TaxID=2162893 RepID=A0A2U2B4H6_9BACT|nr:hypothetical protein [Marinilabilia rubra]PWD97970.1 hypothetical protein DDZ16_18025 [Marinilabilia rubra]
MKRVNLISGLIILVMIFSGSSAMASGDPADVLTGKSLTELGEYQITEIGTEAIGKESFRKFRVEYENGQSPVTILLNERKRCNDFIVRSSVMEIQYVCRKSGFGATTIGNSNYRQLPEQTNQMFLSQEALRNQKTIVNKKVSVENALGLIACYYPLLFENIQNIAAQK